nr:histone-lysine N-methyltransferase ASHH3-like [Tanacetum cinerariifolium]
MDQTGEVVVTTIAATTTTLAATTGIPVMDVTRGAGVRSLTIYQFRHPGECCRAAGTCFKCGQAGHLQKDCKKNTTASTSSQADKKPGRSISKGLSKETGGWRMEDVCDLDPHSQQNFTDKVLKIVEEDKRILKIALTRLEYQFVQFGADQDCQYGAVVCRRKLGVKPNKMEVTFNNFIVNLKNPPSVHKVCCGTISENGQPYDGLP